jgi:catechol 2,3-dioxygenase-like lactoylglutathione lyase family enzyme
MNITLGRVMVFVSDVESCARWYSKHFGFEIIQATHIADEWCELELAPGLALAFHRAFIDGEPVTSPTGGPVNPHKLAFAVDNLAEARSRLIANGVTMFDVAGDSSQSRCDGLDCEQHRFQLIQRPSERAL